MGPALPGICAGVAVIEVDRPNRQKRSGPGRPVRPPDRDPVSWFVEFVAEPAEAFAAELCAVAARRTEPFIL
jgi:hypothetical protein